MQFQRVPSLLTLLLSLLPTALLACTSVYVPSGEPPTEAALADAIALLQASGERVELLEDGLQLEVYVYEWQALPAPTSFDVHDRILHDTMFPEGRGARMLVGPQRSVYVPFASIGAIAARSWPLWSGVELEVLEAIADDFEGPVVIRATDPEDAARLSDAIECARRARSSLPDRSGRDAPVN